jgi:hypothetical protein
MKNLLIPLLLISLSACGSSNSSSNGNPSTLPAPVPSTSPNPQPTDNGATEEQALTGTWTTSCEISSPFYQTKTFSYTSTASSFIYNYYSDSLCTNLIQTLNLSGNTLVEQSPTDSSINFADINSVTVELTIQDPATVNSYNTSNECGFNNWQINQSKMWLGSLVQVLILHFQRWVRSYIQFIKFKAPISFSEIPPREMEVLKKLDQVHSI